MEFLKNLFSKNEQVQVVVKEEVRIVSRLTSEEYKKIESKVSRIAVDHNTNAIEAGFKLGVEHVLKALREGVVIGE